MLDNLAINIRRQRVNADTKSHQRCQCGLQELRTGSQFWTTRKRETVSETKLRAGNGTDRVVLLMVSFYSSYFRSLHLSVYPNMIMTRKALLAAIAAVAVSSTTATSTDPPTDPDCAIDYVV